MIKAQELADPTSCLNKAKDDEMLFVLRGKDLAAPETIRSWVRERIVHQLNYADDPKIVEALACADAMEAARKA
jgi:hypothetical protein